MNVLVCVDDRSTRFVVGRILTQQLGLVVTECADGLEAIQALACGRFHLMLLDVELPTMGGVEVLKLMRDSCATKDLPVIVLSNVRDTDAVKDLLKLGVSDYLLKPPRAERLVEKVQRVLKLLPKARAAEDDGTGVRMSRASRPFVRSAGAMSALALTVPDLPEIVSMATSQILGMIFDADVSTTNAAVEVDGPPSAAASIAIAERFLVTIGVHVTAEVAGRVAPKMFGDDHRASGVDHCTVVATELLHLVAGRLNAILTERAVHSAGAAPLSTPLPSDSDRSLISVAIPEVGNLLLDLTVRDRLAVSADDDTPAIAMLEAVGARGTA